jgi:hypothetical protein
MCWSGINTESDRNRVEGKLTLFLGLLLLYNLIDDDVIKGCIEKGPAGNGQGPAYCSQNAATPFDEMDRWAQRSGVVRSEAIRRLIELGLKAKGK